MNRCDQCAKWKLTEGTTAATPYGMCGRYLPGGFYVLSWTDAQCPAFEARKDWADAVAAEWENTRDYQRSTLAEMIRAAAKAHYEAKP